MKINHLASDTARLRLLSILLLLCFSVSLFSQYHVQIILNTTSSKDIYLAGNINNWNPADSNYRFTSKENILQLEFTSSSAQIEFKLTRGSWNSVEKNKQGLDINNRKFQLKKGNNSFRISVENWGDRNFSAASTRSSQVSILSDSFFSKNLNTWRRIWIYLPTNYNKDSSLAFPVWYMHDGQNLFDNSTSFSGEWQVDEIIDKLSIRGNYGAIIVGIDNGGAERINEYSPWVNKKFNKGGKGDLYIKFIADELKPFIDSAFRTMPCRQYTTLGGSSMGGLISLYGLLARQDVFGSAMVFSPAFGFSKSELDSFIVNNPLEFPSKIHFLAGKLEGPEVVKDMESVRTHLAESDLLEYDYIVRKSGEHNESFWASEFENAFKFLNSNPNELIRVGKKTWIPKSPPCPGITISYPIPRNVRPLKYEIDGGKVLNSDFNSSGKLLVERDIHSSEFMLIISKSPK